MLHSNWCSIIFIWQRCAVDDDCPSFKTTESESISESIKSKQSDRVSSIPVTKETLITTGDQEENKKADVAKAKPPMFDVGKRLSCKWTNGTGPRIGCVRDYPTELQSRALEQVHLSPRVAPGALCSYGPIPSPRPSPKVRLSPRLAYMGLPSPRTPITAANWAGLNKPKGNWIKLLTHGRVGPVGPRNKHWIWGVWRINLDSFLALIL